MKQSSKIMPEVDQDILHNLQVADKIYKKKLTEEPHENQTGEDWIKMVAEVKTGSATKQSPDIMDKEDQIFLHNLQKATEGHKKNLTKKSYEEAGQVWGNEIIEAGNQSLRKQKLIKGSKALLENIGAVLTVIFIIFITLSYYSYVLHWFADIFTGKCSWWSLGFLCTSG